MSASSDAFFEAIGVADTAADVPAEVKQENKVITSSTALTLPCLEEHNVAKKNWQTLLAYVCEHYVGPAHLLQKCLTTNEENTNFALFVQEHLEPVPGKEYWKYEDVMQDAPVRCSLTDFGYQSACTTKPLPFKSVVTSLAAEYDVDGYVTQSEPLRSFVRDTPPGPFQLLGHVKGMARHTTVLVGCMWCWLMNVAIDLYFPELARTGREVYTTVEKHTTMLSVALKNATLSFRGSLRKAHCCLVWVAKLIKLKVEWQLDDAAGIIKTYNSQASSNAQLQGQKRSSIFAILKCREIAIRTLLLALSILGSEKTPWHDEAWANKKIMPGHQARCQQPDWSRRLSVTDESFELMLQWQYVVQVAKLPGLRRKIDRSAMEEASQVAALVVALCTELQTQYPIPSDVIKMQVIEPFTKNEDQQFLLHMQGLIHAKPETLDLREIPLFGELINMQVAKADVSLTGVSSSEVIAADIEKTEYELFEKKLKSDISAVDIYQRNQRTPPLEGWACT